MLINLIIGTNLHFLLFLWKLLPCVSWVQCMCVVTNIHILVSLYTHFSIDSKGPHTYIYIHILHIIILHAAAILSFKLSDQELEG